MLCEECYCVSEVNGKYVTECERYGKCSLGDIILDCPEEQLEEFKKEDNNAVS